METLDPSRRNLFGSDLGTALHLASTANTAKHTISQAGYFHHWSSFCLDHDQDPSLCDVLDPEAKLGYLLVFALRYRKTGATGHPVRAGTVSKVLTSIGQGIAHLGEPDP